MRTIVYKKLDHPETFKKQLLNWGNQHREIAFLDSNNYPQKIKSYNYALAVNAFTAIQTDYFNAFDDLFQYQSQTKDWIFGYLSYDLKNDIEPLVSLNEDHLHFDDLFFFQPQKIFLVQDSVLEIHYLNMCDDEMETDFEEIISTKEISYKNTNKIAIKQRISKKNYLDKISKIKQHIAKGDIYEMNFCMEFFAENVQINPLQTYNLLNDISETPFATFFKNNDKFILCASPERYLRKENDSIISQPIKGTAKRYADLEEDTYSKNALLNNLKEKTENIMIVDLVRNDLSNTAIKGSVSVTKLCQIYSFKQVHQLISTITSKISHTTSPIEVLKTTFPMGSMTGVPKIKALSIIEELEYSKRGVYSGAIGYFDPSGNFDFNVIIRSILYNSTERYVSFSVGSAITNASNPESEYEECMLKADAMFCVLNSVNL